MTFKMTSAPAPIQLFQEFRLLPLQEQLTLSAQINQFLVQYFQTLTREQNDQKDWQLLSQQGLNAAYSDDKPDYSL
jgi:hypothetical protein